DVEPPPARFSWRATTLQLGLAVVALLLASRWVSLDHAHLGKTRMVDEAMRREQDLPEPDPSAAVARTDLVPMTPAAKEAFRAGGVAARRGRLEDGRRESPRAAASGRTLTGGYMELGRVDRGLAFQAVRGGARSAGARPLGDAFADYRRARQLMALNV